MDTILADTTGRFKMTSPDAYVAAQPGWLGALGRLEGVALSLERVRAAALARSSHNTHCWKFSVADKAITILPDLSRRTPSVNPDERHRP